MELFNMQISHVKISNDVLNSVSIGYENLSQFKCVIKNLTCMCMLYSIIIITFRAKGLLQRAKTASVTAVCDKLDTTAHHGPP